MTIKIEHETILRVLEHPQRLRRCLQEEPPSVPLPPSWEEGSVYDGSCYVDFRKPLSPVEPVPSLTEDDDTLSTASVSSDEDYDRRVTFSKDLVTAVWTRPSTEKDDIPNLYYSSEDTARFRQEYRLEKKLLSELSVDHEICAVDEKDFSAMATPSPCNNAYRISRVVVLHNDKLETFVDHPKETDMDGFFDSDSFWSGSITWY